LKLLKLVNRFEVLDYSPQLTMPGGKRRYILVIDLLYPCRGHDKAFELVDVQLFEWKVLFKVLNPVLLGYHLLLWCIRPIASSTISHIIKISMNTIY